MHFDVLVAVAGAIVGFAVGLTGMGGGALMTPMLVLVLHVHPSAAVSSDLVASLMMKPVAGAVHLRRRTADLGLVRWLVVGSVPSAFLGAAIICSVGTGAEVERAMRLALGIALLIAVAGIALRSLTERWAKERPKPADGPLQPRVALTVAVGAVGGLIVGMTSVGSGSLMVAALMFLYPRLTGARLVGTDLIQSIPLVAAAALGQSLFGQISLGLTTSLIVGSVPAAYLGARLSITAKPGLIRGAIIALILLSSLKLLHVNNAVLLAVIVAAVLAGGAALLRQRVRGTRVITLPAQPASIDLTDGGARGVTAQQWAPSGETA